MITDVARALANLLVEGSSTISLSQVAFSHPGLSQENRPALGLYLYALQCHEPNSGGRLGGNPEVPAIGSENNLEVNNLESNISGNPSAENPVSGSFSTESVGIDSPIPAKTSPGLTGGATPAVTSWIDLYFLVIPWDWTHLGVQHLLSEMLCTLLQRGLIREEQLPPEHRGFGNLPVAVTNTPVAELTRLWQSLGVPLQPSLNVTVSIPCRLNSSLNLASLQVATAKEMAGQK